MDRGAWWAAVHGVTESDTTEATQQQQQQQDKGKEFGFKLFNENPCVNQFPWSQSHSSNWEDDCVTAFQGSKFENLEYKAMGKQRNSKYLFVFLRDLTNSSRKCVRRVNYITFLDPQMVSKKCSTGQQCQLCPQTGEENRQIHKNLPGLNSLHSALENDQIFLQFQRNRRCTWANKVRLINLHAQLPSRLTVIHLTG